MIFTGSMFISGLSQSSLCLLKFIPSSFVFVINVCFLKFGFQFSIRTSETAYRFMMSLRPFQTRPKAGWLYKCAAFFCGWWKPSQLNVLQQTLQPHCGEFYGLVTFSLKKSQESLNSNHVEWTHQGTILKIYSPLFKNLQFSYGKTPKFPMVFVYSSSSTKYVVKKPTFPTNLPTRRVEVESNSWFPPHGVPASSQTLVEPRKKRPQKDGTVGFL